MMDFKKLGVPDNEGNVGFLVIIDLTSGYLENVPLKSMDQEHVTLTLNNSVFPLINVGAQWYFDKGSENVSMALDSICQRRGFTVHYSSERSKETQGSVERVMQTFTNSWKKALNDNSMDPKRVMFWVNALMHTHNKTYDPKRGNTPFFIKFGREAPSTLDSELIMGNRSAFEALSNKSLEQALHESHKAATFADKLRIQLLAKRVRAYEIKRALNMEVPSFGVGSLVLLHLGDSNGGYSDKTRCHAGPFEVVAQVSTSNYSIKGADEEVVTVHVYKLVPYQPTMADIMGYGCLAPSAVGAAQARLFGYEVERAKAGMISLISAAFKSLKL